MAAKTTFGHIRSMQPLFSPTVSVPLKKSGTCAIKKVQNNFTRKILVRSARYNYRLFLKVVIDYLDLRLELCSFGGAEMT